MSICISSKSTHFRSAASKLLLWSDVRPVSGDNRRWCSKGQVLSDDARPLRIHFHYVHVCISSGFTVLLLPYEKRWARGPCWNHGQPIWQFPHSSGIHASQIHLNRDDKRRIRSVHRIVLWANEQTHNQFQYFEDLLDFYYRSATHSDSASDNDIDERWSKTDQFDHFKLRCNFDHIRKPLFDLGCVRFLFHLFLLAQVDAWNETDWTVRGGVNCHWQHLCNWLLCLV